MQDLRELIERASKVAGSDAALARMIETAPPNLAMWKSGAKPCPPADVALMASVAGLNADEWLVRAVMAKHEGTAKGEKLMRVLKASLATGAVIASSSVAAAVSKTSGLILDVARCILC